jgi:hypothetical protein
LAKKKPHMKVLILKKKHSFIGIIGYLLEEEGPSCIERKYLAIFNR